MTGDDIAPPLLTQSFQWQNSEMSDARRAPSARQDELTERAYSYVLAHGFAELSLRPLAKAIESSPRVLLFLFGSKDGLIRAILSRARTDELALLDQLDLDGQAEDLAAMVRATWGWLVAEAHRPLLILWLEVYARSLTDPDGPWAGFARQTIEDWLTVLAAGQPRRRRTSARGVAERTLALAVVRGALLDLLATGDTERTTAAVGAYIQLSTARIGNQATIIGRRRG
jgi:AcrR family transcriptional regulator